MTERYIVTKNNSVMDLLADDRSSGLTLGQFSEAEAHIIAWALNKVAEGMKLEAWLGRHHDPAQLEHNWASRTYSATCSFYDGPTDGVAL